MEPLSDAVSDDGLVERFAQQRVDEGAVCLRQRAERSPELVDDGVARREPGRVCRLDRRPRKRDRKSVVYGKSVSVRVDIGGRRTIKKTSIIKSIPHMLDARIEIVIKSS